MPMVPPVVPPMMPPVAGPPPMPPMMPPGMPPDMMARKNGGRIDPKTAVHKHETKHHKGEPKTQFASGGKVDGGAGGGLGRLQKARDAKAR
jgi:hypothetical protein